MKIKLPQYTSKDYLVLGIVLLPVTLIINSVVFGSAYFSGWVAFLLPSFFTAFAFSIHFTICGAVAVAWKKRFPDESQLAKRLTLMIFTFFIISGGLLYCIFKGYELFPFLNYSFNYNGFIWAYMGMAIINIFLTLLHEGIARYEKWKANLEETESLKKVYRQSRLLSLKSQINPHFLFNCLNSLSCLIHEDEKKGEDFLDEMSKVYRYMLQNDEEQLVPLATELKFLDSYIHLLETRHNDGLAITISVTETDKHKLLPPLSIQVVIESILMQNSICKECPLEIRIYSDKPGSIIIWNNALPKFCIDPNDIGSGVDNLVMKYRLLNKDEVLIVSNEKESVVNIPLIDSKEEVQL